MALVKMLDVLNTALKNNYAVGAFNADNLEMVQAFIQAAEIERSPVILQISQGAINYSGLADVAQMARFAAEQTNVPVVVHLDHGKNFEQNVLALKSGASSLGVDKSMLSYEENVSISAKVAELAHYAGLNAEGGFGYVPAFSENLSQEEIDKRKTDPNQVRRFVDETNVDFLAVALGSMRSMSERKVILDIDLLKEIKKQISIPFVLHGSSGVLWESIKEAIKLGVAKVNLAACFDSRFTAVIRSELINDPSIVNFRVVLGKAREQVLDLAREQYRLLGSNNRV